MIWHVKNLVDNAYKQHLHLTGRKIADDPAKFWEFIKDRKNDRRFVEFYSFRNEEVTGQAAADAFAEYFSSVFQSEVPLLNPLDASLAASSHADATLISVSEFSESDLRLAARRLKPKSSGGPDGIPVFLAKDCISILKDPILYLFNLSLARSTYSEYGYYPYLYPSSFVAGMVDLETLKFRRVVQTIVHYLSIVHHKVDNPIVLGMVRLLVPKRLAWNEQGTVSPRRRPRLLWWPQTRTNYALHAPTVRALGLIEDMIARDNDIDIFADHFKMLCAKTETFVNNYLIFYF
ncbi:hypothetical protein HW555_009467 [Spodoptera exigua]|uniref:Uncharacterized protein n=1 Tax=Spodoptera exigua TaxID=7107 RepID=A0A835L1T9_SPOEX|nr:hypothetical protein HW555_009467 [Spodoptera exigua]